MTLMPEALTEKKITDFRKKVCEVATRQFAERGVDGVSMRSLARELGYTATALYSYYKNKDELLAETRAAAMDRLYELLLSRMNSSEDELEKFYAIGDAYSGFVSREPAAYQLAFSPDQSSGPIYPGLKQANGRLHRLLGEHMKKMVNHGLLYGDPDALARMLWVTLHGSVFLQMAGKLDERNAGFDQQLKECLRLFYVAASSKSESETAQKQKTNEQFSFNL